MILVFWAALSMLIAVSYSNPIGGGTDVGKVTRIGRKLKISGQDEFPFMALLIIFQTKTVSATEKQEKVTSCSGVILSESAVLTAAHCLHAPPEVELDVYVKVGIVHLQYELGQELRVIKYFLHEEYTPECSITNRWKTYCANDISIAWLEEPLVFGSTVNKAVISDSLNNLEGQKGWIIGWGLNEEGMQLEMLQKAYMKVIPNTICQAIYDDLVISTNMFCLQSDGKPAGSCVGDSGGPFVINGIVYGISTYGDAIEVNGNAVCDTTSADVYTNIGAYNVWITEKLTKGPNLIDVEKKVEDSTQASTSRKRSQAQVLWCAKRAKYGGISSE